MIVIPSSAWRQLKSGQAVIDTDIGLQLWDAARDARDAKAKASARSREIDTLIRGIIGPTGSSLVLKDKRAIALLARLTRRELDKTAIMRELGVPNLDDYLIDKPTTTLEIADHLDAA